MTETHRPDGGQESALSAPSAQVSAKGPFVLHRPAVAGHPVAYYPPGAIKRAEWLTAEDAEAARGGLIDAPAWTVMSRREARAEDAAAAKVARDAAVREALRGAFAEHGERKFTETPGDLMAFPQLRGGAIVKVPVVVLRAIPDGPACGYVVKFADNAIRHLPQDWPLGPCGVDEWLALTAREGGAP